MSDENWDEFLRAAIIEHDIDLVHQALIRGADPNADVDGDGHTALYWAVCGGQKEVTKKVTQELLNAGARVACEDKADSTSLHAAVEDNNFDIVEILLNADGAVALNWFDYVDRTPLMCAVENNHSQIAQLLIQAGADVNAHNEARSGDTALHVAVSRGSLEMAELLIKAGADPTIRGWMWNTPLSKAQERKKPEGRKLAATLEQAAKTGRTRS